MIILGRGFNNHFGPRHRCECEADKTLPLANSSVTLVPRAVRTCGFAVIMGQDNQEGSGIHGADLYR